VSLASAFGVFAAAFLMRPIGGALFGHIGDRFGRKRALLLSAGLMTVATFAIGLLPTYAMIGPAAPFLLLGFRLLQGLSVGGEYATSIVFLVERSDPRRRGLLGSVACIGASCGTLLGSGVGALIAALLDPAELQAWGWRVPFLLGIALGGTAFVLRRVMVDDSLPAAHKGDRLPFAEAFRTEWPAMLRGILLCASFAASFYLVFVYMATYMQQADALPARRALQINTLSMVLMLAAVPCFAALSDRVGRKPVLAASMLGILLLSVPLFLLMGRPDAGSVLLGQCGFALLIAAYSGTVPAALVEMFRTRTRCTALAISYNTAFAILGGTAPMVAVYLVSREHGDLGPAYYLMAVAVISLVGLMTIRDRTGEPLR
jgi:MHS family proline/betaine transporter-like MFS transporter